MKLNTFIKHYQEHEVIPIHTIKKITREERNYYPHIHEWLIEQNTAKSYFHYGLILECEMEYHWYSGTWFRKALDISNNEHVPSVYYYITTVFEYSKWPNWSNEFLIHKINQFKNYPWVDIAKVYNRVYKYFLYHRHNYPLYMEYLILSFNKGKGKKDDIIDFLKIIGKNKEIFMEVYAKMASDFDAIPEFKIITDLIKENQELSLRPPAEGGLEFQKAKKRFNASQCQNVS